MIIKYFQLKKTDKKKLKILLFYGKNNGLKEDTINDVFLENFDGSLNRYDEQYFIADYENIISELLNESLFENKKIIIISRVSEKIYKFIDDINKRNINDVVIILKTGILEKKSKLRTFFEKSKTLIIVPFYDDNSQDLTQIVVKFLSNNKIKMSRESMNLLINRANGDRENIKVELEKIYNYSLSNKKIDFEIVKKLSNLTENFGVSELADSFLERNSKNVVKILNENNFAQDDCILIIRTLLNKSKRLLNIIERNQEIKNIDEVISTTRPPIFWKDKEIIKNQVKNWKDIELKNKIYQINEIESLVKRNSQNSLNIVSDFILNY